MVWILGIKSLKTSSMKLLSREQDIMMRWNISKLWNIASSTCNQSKKTTWLPSKVNTTHTFLWDSLRYKWWWWIQSLLILINMPGQTTFIQYSEIHLITSLQLKSFWFNKHGQHLEVNLIRLLHQDSNCWEMLRVTWELPLKKLN